MNTATIAGAASTLMFAGSTLPMVVRAARTRDLSSYSRSHLFLTNVGNAVHTLYIASLPPGPVWLLHCMYSAVAAFMLAAHRRWAHPGSTAGSRLESPGTNRFSQHELAVSGTRHEVQSRSSRPRRGTGAGGFRAARS